MSITADHIYSSILYRAADIYEVETDDVQRDIGEKFDPIVKFMAGALASELEQVYRRVDDTESRLQRRLAKVLLPEYFHLPQSAHALATAVPSDTLVIDETAMFATELSEDEAEIEKDIAFSPVFPSRLLPANIKVIATETTILDPKARISLRQKKEKESAGRIIIGIEAKEDLQEWNDASLFFDLRGSKKNESERALFFAAVANSQCRFNGHLLNTTNGLPQNDLIIEDYLNGNERLQSHIRARYERQFLTFNNKKIPETTPGLPEEVLRRWFSTSMKTEDVETQLSKLDKDLDKPLHWLEIELSRPIEVEQLSSRLTISFNVFPVVNRRLNGHKDHHYFPSKNSIKWVSLEPEEDFVAMRRVYTKRAPYTTYVFKPFSDFREDGKPAYTLRHGGVGRWDDFNAWQRLAYVVSILQDDYKANDLVQEAAASLSLEDVHSLLGKKISQTARAQKPTRDVYVLLHNRSMRGTGDQVMVEYWTSQGASGNEVAAKTALICTSVEKSSLEKESIELVTESTGGRDPLNATQQLSAMKSALLSRGRIVTREDVKVFCKEFLQDKLERIVVKDGVGTDPRYDFGMTRLLDIILIPAKKSKRQDDWEGLCHQVQILLEQKSTSSIPIRVQVGE